MSPNLKKVERRKMGTPGRSVESAWVGEEEFEPGQITLTKSWRNEWHERIVLSANRQENLCPGEHILCEIFNKMQDF